MECTAAPLGNLLRLRFLLPRRMLPRVAEQSCTMLAASPETAVGEDSAENANTNNSTNNSTKNGTDVVATPFTIRMRVVVVVVAASVVLAVLMAAVAKGEGSCTAQLLHHRYLNRPQSATRFGQAARPPQVPSSVLHRCESLASVQVVGFLGGFLSLHGRFRTLLVICVGHLRRSRLLRCGPGEVEASLTSRLPPDL